MIMNRIEREKKTVQKMIRLYCHKHHQGSNGLCSACSMLEKYATDRTNKCKFGKNKPVCSNCPVHCYKPEKRNEIKTVMRYAGPRMIYKHPVLAVLHIVDSKLKN
jgi:hypothetical protein